MKDDYKPPQVPSYDEIMGTSEKKNPSEIGSKEPSVGGLVGDGTTPKTRAGSIDFEASSLEAGNDLSKSNVEAGKEIPPAKNSLELVGEINDLSKVGTVHVSGGTGGAAAGASIGSFGGPVGTGIGAAVGAAIGGAIGSNSIDPNQIYTDMYGQLGELGVPGMTALADGMQDGRNLLGQGFDKTYGKLLQGVGLGSVGSGISGAIKGIDTKAMKAYGDSIAKDIALQDLQNKYASYLQGQGFENRVNVQDNETTRARTEGLRQILANMDKTNLG